MPQQYPGQPDHYGQPQYGQPPDQQYGQQYGQYGQYPPMQMPMYQQPARSYESEKPADPTKLFVGSLPIGITKEELRPIFEAHGQLAEVSP